MIPRRRDVQNTKQRRRQGVLIDHHWQCFGCNDPYMLHRSVTNMQKVSKPLKQLSKKAPFILNNKADDSFKSLKNIVASELFLKPFSPDYPINATTNGSKKDTGAVLEQYFRDGRHPDAFLSRTLNGADQNYASHD